MILITGAGGFVGSHLVRKLARKEKVVCLVRSSVPDAKGVKIVRGDMTDKNSLIEATKGVSAVIHLATAPASASYKEMQRINVEGAANLIEACKKNGVSRIVAVSSVATLAAEKSDYGKTKDAADRLFARSDLGVTILKPDFIYGKGCRGFEAIVNSIKKLPAVPVIGSGKNRRQPIHVDDVVSAITACLHNKKTSGKTYLLAGRESMQFNDMLDLIMAAQGKKKAKVHVPVWLALTASYVSLGKTPLTKTAIMGITQDRVLNVEPMMRDLDVDPMRFEAALRKSL